MARGLGKLMGFDIMINFNLPYFSTNPREFWQRWHISLSTFLRDYLYIPLGGNQKGSLITYRNLAVTMLLGGLWHGAGWTFVVWGAYQGILLIVHRLFQPILAKIRGPDNVALKNIYFLIKVFFFFQWICLGWLFFRAQSFNQIFEMFRGLFSGFSLEPKNINNVKQIIFFTGLLCVIETFQYYKNDLIIVLRWPWAIRYAFYGMLLYAMVFYGTETKAFIYFQF